jgi:hypothetical protein
MFETLPEKTKVRVKLARRRLLATKGYRYQNTRHAIERPLYKCTSTMIVGLPP